MDVAYAEGTWHTVTEITGFSRYKSYDDFYIPTTEWRIIWAFTPYSTAEWVTFEVSATRAGYTGSIPRVAYIEGDIDNIHGTEYVHKGDDEYYISVNTYNVADYTIKVEYYQETFPSPTPSAQSGDALYGAVGLIFIIGIIVLIILIILKRKKHNAE